MANFKLHKLFKTKKEANDKADWLRGYRKRNFYEGGVEVRKRSDGWGVYEKMPRKMA